MFTHRSFFYYGLGASLGLAAGAFDFFLRYWATLAADVFEWAGWLLVRAFSSSHTCS
jgi:hypothetical protein